MLGTRGELAYQVVSVWSVSSCYGSSECAFGELLGTVTRGSVTGGGSAEDEAGYVAFCLPLAQMAPALPSHRRWQRDEWRRDTLPGSPGGPAGK